MNQQKLTNHSSVGTHPDRPTHPALAAGRIGHAEEPSDHHAGGFLATLRGLARSTLATLAVGLAAVTVMTVLTMTAIAGENSDPAATVPLLAPIATAIASLVGGITMGLNNRRRSVANALIGGTIMAGMLCLLGFLSGGDDAGSWLVRLLPLPLYAIGGLLTRAKPRPVTHTAGNHLACRH